ncbi:MAG: thiosulfate oxidation carrier complex protein SoxZ [Gallionellaceae bacterium]|nr:thiosulfate oxidation carrier complex protein SoxZ [Gallionellaceae bacterium]
MSSPTKMKAAIKGEYAEVKMLMQHVMENGRRKDDEGNVIPAWYITAFKVKHKDEVVFEGQFGTSVSKNPYLICRFFGAVAGEKITVSWVDNRGEQREDDAIIE